MEDLASLVQAHFAFEVEAVHVQLCFAKGTAKEKYLLGELSDHCKNGLVRIKTGRVRSKDILALWVEHLCYCIADGQGLNSSLFAQDKGIFFREIPADFAYQRLKE
jgi:exodeoxyribonuclease V gamma subunit